MRTNLNQNSLITRDRARDTMILNTRHKDTMIKDTMIIRDPITMIIGKMIINNNDPMILKLRHSNPTETHQNINPNLTINKHSINNHNIRKIRSNNSLTNKHPSSSH